MNFISDRIDFIRENKLWSFIIFILTIVIVNSIWSYYHTERITTTQYVLTEQAKLNGYYAVELLLNNQSDEKLGYEIAYTQMDMDLATLVDELPIIDPESEQKPTLIIRNIGDSLMSNHKYQQLIDWVMQGGHLITFNKSSISDHEWQDVDKRLQDIEKNLGSTNKAELITTDEELTDLLNDINKYSSNSLLNQLGIYSVDVDFDFDFDFDEAEKNVSEEQKKRKQDFKELSKTLDKLGLKDTSNDNNHNGIGDSEEKTKLNRQQIRRRIEDFYQSPSVLMLTNHTTQQAYMVDSDDWSYLNSDIFYAKYPDAQPNLTLSPANPVQIRQVLKRQLLKSAEMMKYGEELDKKNQKNGDLYFTPREQHKAIEIMLKLSDKQLIAMFNNMKHTILDSDLGQGRITVLNELKLWDNPTGSIINQAKKNRDFINGISDERLLNPWNIVDTSKVDLFEEGKISLYNRSNAILLTTLTANSDEIWLFPNIDVDTLPVLLWKKARLAVLGLMLLTFIWVWSLYNRFGKIQQLNMGVDADIFRYFRQIGRYGWEYDKAKRLSKSTRREADKLAKKALGLTINTPLTINHLPQLSKLLQTRLKERLSENLAEDELLQMIDANHIQVNNLLAADQLKEALLPTGSDLDSFTAHGFTEYTQTLWLVQWLLK